MALTDAYATREEARAFKNQPNSDDDIVLGWKLEAASRYLDRQMGMPGSFNTPSTPTTYIYEPGQAIQPIASSSGLIVKASSTRSGVVWADIDALVAETDYALEPYGAPDLPEPRPYTAIRLLLWGAPSDPIIHTTSDRYGLPWLQITGLHGWPGGVPQAIRWATIELAYLISGDSFYSTDRVSESFETALGVAPQARAILRGLYMSYSRFGGVGIA